MKMVVIRGTGLVGSKLVAKLRSDGHDVSTSPDALEGARVVIDVSNASTADLLAAESAARVGHHVALSAAGADRLHEDLVKSGPVPYTIVRATELFERIWQIADSGRLRVPPALVQPVAADDVAGTLADIALGSPLNDTVELAGPETFRLDDLARRVLQARGEHGQVLTGEPNERSSTPGDDARIASTRFEDWISRSSRDPAHLKRSVKPRRES